MGIKEIGSIGAFIVIAVVLAAAISGMMNGSGSNEVTGNVVAEKGGETQEVIVSYSAGGYQLKPSTVTAGAPVKLIGDNLPGCMKALRIPELGVSHNFGENDNEVEFTPSSPGNYLITCSMGMGTGELVVE
jgi:plastocyanin domain-containing protein